MARPEKTGLDYFPLDVDIFESDKMLAISGEFAVKGEIITLRLLCEIYRNGYFVEYSELLKNKLARLSGLSVNLIDEVVGKLVRYGFFDESIFREHSVLTSKGIQKRYLEACKRRKNILCVHYWLLNGINVDINPTTKRINVDISTQSKVKESKEKENYVKEGDNVDDISGSSSPPKPQWHQYTTDELETELISAKIWHGDLGKSVGITDPDDIPKWIVKFFVFLRGQGKVHTTIREAKSHCQSWIRRQLELGKTLNSGPADKPTDMENPNRPPDNSGKWLFLNGKWRDTTTFTNAQKRKFGLIPEVTV